MLTLADLGLADTGRVEPVGPQQPALPVSGALEPGSVAARALWEIWRGTPSVVVSSPPGAGKTTLVAELVDRLVSDAHLKVVVAAPTRAMCRSLAIRFTERMPEAAVHLAGSAFKDMAGLGPNVLVDDSRASQAWNRSSAAFSVRTLASAASYPPECDVLVVDEAYQATMSQVAAAAGNAAQVLLIGDPGQILPVITVDTSPWEGLASPPHERAPECFLRRSDCVALNLPATYRLGQATTSVVGRLYDFDFDSRRPPVRLEGVGELSTLVLDPSDLLSDPVAMVAVADAACSMVGRRATFAGGSARLGPDDVVVVAARNEQVTALSAILTSRGQGGIKVGTADRVQGGQWAAVVALDPLFGAPGVSEHSASLGRLCVMLSRHYASLTWVTDSAAVQVAQASPVLAGEDRDRHVAVRTDLLAHAHPHTVAA